MLKRKQLQCIALMVDTQKSQKQIASELKVTENTISNWKKNPEFVEEYETELKRHIKSVAAKAFQKEVKLLSAESEMVQLAAAKDLLDRAGFKPDDNLNISGNRVIIIDDCNQ